MTHLLDACFKLLHHYSTDVLTVDTLFNGLISA